MLDKNSISSRILKLKIAITDGKINPSRRELLFLLNDLKAIETLSILDKEKIKEYEKDIIRFGARYSVVNRKDIIGTFDNDDFMLQYNKAVEHLVELVFDIEELILES